MSNEKPVTTPRPKRISARDRVLQAATDLFYRQGIRAVGVDQIVKTADVAKISMYRAFPSKDDLIVAYLRDRDVAFWQRWDSAIAGAEEPEARLRAALDFLRTAMTDPGYCGCPLANFSSEYRDREHAGHRVVETSKSKLRNSLFDLCDRMDVRDPRRLADALFLLVEGGSSVTQTMPQGDPSAGDAFAWAAEALLAAQKRGNLHEAVQQ